MGILKKEMRPCPSSLCQNGTEHLRETRMGQEIHWTRKCRTCKGKGGVPKK